MRAPVKSVTPTCRLLHQYPFQRAAPRNRQTLDDAKGHCAANDRVQNPGTAFYLTWTVNRTSCSRLHRERGARRRQDLVNDFVIRACAMALMKFPPPMWDLRTKRDSTIRQISPSLWRFRAHYSDCPCRGTKGFKHFDRNERPCDSSPRRQAFAERIPGWFFLGFEPRSG